VQTVRGAPDQNLSNQHNTGEKIMKSQKMSFVIAIVAVLALSAMSFAQSNNAASGAAAPQAQPSSPAAFGTNAHLALSYSTLSQTVVRSKGVKSVTMPSTGKVCITPSVSLNLKKIYPLVSIEWGNSSGNALLAFWRDTTLSSGDCGAGVLEVQTFDFNAGGAPVPSNNVAFDFVIE
jgi:hypothetical protein